MVARRSISRAPTIPAQYKGIYVVTANGVTIENLELTGAHISAANGENAAAIRMEGEDLTVRSCVIHENQNGILGGSAGTLTVEYSRVLGNGVGDGCNGGGCTHNLYIGKIDSALLPPQLVPRHRHRHGRQGAPAEVARSRQLHRIQPHHRRRAAPTATKSTCRTVGSPC